MSAIASYRALLRIVGPAYIVVAFLGRIPLAMSQLGVLVLVSTTTGRYGLGGAAAGVLAIANAIGSPLAGALADRIGQSPDVRERLTGVGLELNYLGADDFAKYLKEQQGRFADIIKRGSIKVE